MNDDEYMAEAAAFSTQARYRAPPNPWVGALVVQADGAVVGGATQAPGGNHAEIEALEAAPDPVGATLYCTLEPCSHRGRTGACTEAIIAAGVRRVVIALEDPDPQVSGAGISRLRAAGIDVDVGVGAEEAARQLRPYLHHRRTGRPWVVLKLAASLDGRTAAPDGTSQWITGEMARRDAHQLRAESQAVLVGTGTVRADDPALTVRIWPGGAPVPDDVTQPRRVVLGSAPADARIHPCLEWTGEIEVLLDRLGSEGVLQLLVEGGPTVAQSFQAAGLVDQYVFYLAPVLFGGDDGAPLFRGPGAPTIADVWRGEIDRGGDPVIREIGGDLRIDLVKPGGGPG